MQTNFSTEKNLFLESVAQNYLDYLTALDKGHEKIKIQQVEIGIFGLILYLEYKIKSLESLVLRTKIGEFKLDSKESLSVTFYDEKRKILHIGIEEDLRDSLSLEILKVKDSLELISDLRFLVQNVINFYAQDLPLEFPKNPPLLKPEIDALKALKNPPNTEQLNALKGIFNSPFSYIWGAAGSGKTKIVLLHALAFYLKAGLKVAILAPTNNALEQCLATLIVSLEKIGFDTSAILRLGAPTQSFAQNFPNNCDLLIQEKPIEYKTKLKNTQIFAMTLDTFLRRSDLQEITFEHYFVDEAAFASLIKILPLCAFSKPITLLGDHKQLQPISMLSKQDALLKEWNLSLFWQYSALFIEEFFKTQSPLDFFKKPPDTTPKLTNIFSLRQTYRYGDNLAKLLDSYIYHNNLQGNNTQTNLYCLNTTNLTQNHQTLERTNSNESSMCCSLAKDFIDRNLEFAILTPFVNQRQLILKTLPILFSKECVLTIHASQGQEFDYIIFSPVVLHYHLNDSRNPNALFALNVALSRAKKAIIIVCDRAYWLRQKGQFLSDLIKLAQPYTIENLITQ